MPQLAADAGVAQGMRKLQRRRLMNAIAGGSLDMPQGPAGADMIGADDDDAGADAFDVADVLYTVTVVTAAERGSATTANVWVELHGQRGDTGCGQHFALCSLLRAGRQSVPPHLVCVGSGCVRRAACAQAVGGCPRPMTLRHPTLKHPFKKGGARWACIL